MALTITHSTKHLLSRLDVSVFFLAILVAVLMSVRLKLRAIQSIGLNRFGFQTTNLKHLTS